MTPSMSHLGSVEALATFGLEKAASGFMQAAKQMMVGDPGKFVQQFRGGKLFSDGGMLREAFRPQPMRVNGKASLGGIANNLMLYGLPAYGVYQAAQAPEGQRGSMIGMALGGAVGGLAGSPLGLLGQGLGANLGANLGRSLGGSFDRRASQPLDPSSGGGSGVPLR